MNAFTYQAYWEHFKIQGGMPGKALLIRIELYM
jgi:hypothetical protein